MATGIMKNTGVVDIKISAAIGLCLLMKNTIPEFQAMTACISVLLCVQNSVKESWKVGLIRLVVTAIGGIIAFAVILADEALGNSWLFILLIMLGAFLTLFFCKVAKVPVFNARIGGVTFILVVLTKMGSERINYAIFRLLSTLYGVLAVILITAVFSLVTQEKKQE
jgi:uncharacterized membrane protein YgaE (UPF0421/DUF939 family)